MQRTVGERIWRIGRASVGLMEAPRGERTKRLAAASPTVGRTEVVLAKWSPADAVRASCASHDLAEGEEDCLEQTRTRTSPSWGLLASEPAGPADMSYSNHLLATNQPASRRHAPLVRASIWLLFVWALAGAGWASTRAEAAKSGRITNLQTTSEPVESAHQVASGRPTATTKTVFHHSARVEPEVGGKLAAGQLARRSSRGADPVTRGSLSPLWSLGRKASDQLAS